MSTIINDMESEMKPVHPGAVLREDILKEMNISVTRAAKELNVSRKQLSEVVNEAAAVSAEMAVRLESGFGVSAEFWLDMQKKYDIWKVRTSGRVQGIHPITSAVSI
ncbi:addiction module antidote protein, HigA family [Dyadobacter sp. SG02]|uniref:HigA family addiction module antitoxin n=1 Tax=Dyadobacter sp. SG02 TaxID=1855291 RepID=UPI0008D4F79B|nr:HigA family addiction module antitoxin [Dyadobacter sp. SG02]SEJ30787.1 addiction module antidote protein, HigA family [Dyadobacter sp. SG02]